MSLLSENIIPGDKGKVFETNAKEASDLKEIKSLIETIEGINKVEIDQAVFPRQIKVYSESLVKVIDVEKVAIKSSFHLIPKSSLPL